MRTFIIYLVLVVSAFATEYTSTYVISNDKPFDVTIRFVRVGPPDDTQYIEGIKTIKPGEVYTKSVTLTYTEEYGEALVIQYLSGAGDLVGNSYISSTDPKEQYSVMYMDLPNNSTHNLLASDYIDDLGHLPTPDDEKTLWLVDDTTLTADVFREGIDKVVAGTKFAASSSGGGMTKAEFQTTKTEAVAEAQYEASSSSPSHEDMAAAGETNRADMEAAMAAVPVPSIGTATEPSSAPALLTIRLGPYTINADPASNSEMSGALAFIKTINGWALLLVFSWWCWAEFQQLAYASVGMTQAKGNPIVGGTGAQATALAAAGLIAVVFIAIPAAYWVFVTTDLSALNSNPFGETSGIPGAALYLLHLVFPYSLALLLIAEMFIIRKAGTTLLLGANITLKFIVP